ncbi:MAG: hypothetical protein IKP72_03295 [Clostridia bacterium]|nr:hypothetical protein [Clostridia bacterium]
MSNKRAKDHSIFASLFKRLISIVQFVWKHIVLAALIVAVLTAATAGMFFREKLNTATMTLTFNYDNATSGLAPNGVKYEISDVTSSEVMWRALELASIDNLSASALADCLTVSPPSGHAYSISDESTYFIATTYNVTITGSEALQAQSITLRSLLSLIGRAYQEFFLDKYTDRGIRIDIDSEPNQNEEFMETITKLNQQAIQLQNYLKLKDSEDSDFVAINTGESFSSLRQQVQNLINVRIEDCRAYIFESGVARNRKRYLSKIEYQNESLSIQRQKHMKAYEIRMDVIEQYDGDMTSTVLIPTESSTSKFYMSKTQIGIDYVALAAANNVTKASTIQRTIDNNNNIYSHVANASGNTQKEMQKAEQLLNECRAELTRLLNLTNATCEEYSELEASNYLLYSIGSPGLLDSVGGKKLFVFVLLYMGVVVLLVNNILTKREKNEKL